MTAIISRQSAQLRRVGIEKAYFIRQATIHRSQTFYARYVVRLKRLPIRIIFVFQNSIGAVENFMQVENFRSECDERVKETY